MALANEAQNTGTITNEVHGSSGLTWDEANFPWNEATGTWDNPYNMTNEAQNTGSITNEAQS